MPAKLVQLARAELSPTITPLAEKLIFVNSLNIYMGFPGRMLFNLSRLHGSFYGSNATLNAFS